ncbi:aquaporin AQPAe.a-like [Mizuhopecten yessoensis]|uniref:Aquaporin-4 n=1 Tax=Mizuhopecten yessoensis TaxID=6573 RepID=A0A210QH41_MIZYE|nr:aquaporin AQPAe.a-like [Mizuhopecten yessoensis]OWF48037.1 Aquaporin-4 [Mizuhopecten yessoensis]
MWKIMQENLEDLTSPNLWRSVAAELVGTMFLVFFGCASALPQQSTGGVSGTDLLALPPSTVQIALTFGLIVGTMVWAIGHISGGHINPAVTIGALVTRRVSIVRGIMYIVAQILGGLVGAGILYGLTPMDTQGTLGVNALKGAVTDAQGFGVELMITFVLVFTVLASIDTERNDLNGSAPLTIGLAVVAGHLVAIQYTGCSLNPARSFGPAVVTGKWENHWVFWIGPLVGGFLAAILYEYLFSAGATFSRTRKFLIRSRKPKEKPASDEKVEIIEIEMKKEAEPEAEVDVEAAQAEVQDDEPLIDGKPASE